MIERWKKITNYPDYEVSNFGRVKSRKRMIRFEHAVTGEEHFREIQERVLKMYYSKHGYPFVGLRKNNKCKSITIHKLVATEFVSNPRKVRCVNHKDGNKTNNFYKNLEWVTLQENLNHATETGLMAKGEKVGTSVLSDKCVIAIKGLLKIGWSHKSISELFKVSRGNISQIATGKTWKHIII